MGCRVSPIVSGWKMAKNGRDYTIGERAIMLLGARAGKSHEEINRLLEIDAVESGRDIRLIPTATYKALTGGGYRRLFDLDASYEWLHIEEPRRQSIPHLQR